MQRIEAIAYAVLLGAAIGPLGACAGSDAALELAGETRSVVSELRADGERIIAADERTERLLAALAGARRQVAERDQIELGLEHRAGLAAKKKEDLVIRNLERIVGEDLGVSGLVDNAGYSPDAVLGDYPPAPSPVSSLREANAKLAELEKPLSFKQRVSVYVSLAKAVRESLKEAAEETEAAAAEVAASSEAINLEGK